MNSSVKFKFLNRYLELNCDHSLDLEIDSEVELIVVIPAYKENYDTLLETLLSLEKANSNSNVKNSILLLLNYRDTDTLAVKQQTSDLFDRLKQLRTSLDLKICMTELTGRSAGVGMARKRAMDWAFKKFLDAKKDGLIINLDADTTVQANYFTEIYNFFAENKHISAASIFFEHRYSEKDERFREAIDAYEGHLRYFINMQRLLFLPYAFQTVGSAMAVKAFAYAKVGGMPRKQAGEDFYFIHKFSKIGELGEINSTKVFPSNRSSDRVPFGTGKAVNDILDSAKGYHSYNWRSFLILQDWMEQMLTDVMNYMLGQSKAYLIRSDDNDMERFIERYDIEGIVREILNNTNNFESFLKRFFQNFDAFTLMKYLHFMRDLGNEDQPLVDCLEYICDRLGLKTDHSLESSLAALRVHDNISNYAVQCKAGLMSSLSSISASRSIHQDRRE